MDIEEHYRDMGMRDSSGVTKVRRYVLENKIPPHNKAYIIDVFDDYTVTTMWGAIGTRLQSQSHSLPSVPQAAAFVETLVRNKLRKGYSIVETPSGAKSVERPTLRVPKEMLDRIKIIQKEEDDLTVEIKDGKFIV